MSDRVSLVQFNPGAIVRMLESGEIDDSVRFMRSDRVHEALKQQTERQAGGRERSYLDGSRAAWLSVLRLALKELGTETGQNVDADILAELGRHVLERVEAVRALRSVCERFGDTQWPDSLYLADIIEKHLERPLEDWREKEYGPDR